MDFTLGSLDLDGITKFLNEYPCYRLEAQFTGRNDCSQQDDASFLIGIYHAHSDLYKPGIHTKNLDSGLAIISRTVENLTHRSFDEPVIKCVEIDAQQLPLHEVFPNLAETLRNNPKTLLYASRDGQKIRTSLSTYYNPSRVNAYSGPSHIAYFEDEMFRPDLLEALRFSDYNIETFLTGMEAEVMLGLREMRVNPDRL